MMAYVTLVPDLYVGMRVHALAEIGRFRKYIRESRDTDMARSYNHHNFNW